MNKKMSRYVYISCDRNERDLEEVKSLCLFLQSSNCVIQFAPPLESSFYRVLEESIERSDAFVAVVGMSYSCSTWLNHELHYANTLRSMRFSPRPRIFGLHLHQGYDLPRCSERIELEWLCESNRELLLIDLPERIVSLSDSV